MTDQIPSKSIRINFKDSEMEQIMFLMKHFSKSSVHDTLRAVLDKTYQREKEILLKYSSSAPKETQAEKAMKLKTMSDEDLTKLLYEIGFFQDGPMAGAPDCTLSYSIGIDKTGSVAGRVELVKYTQKDPQFPPYVNAGRSLDEIINDVIKSKLV